MPIVRILGNSSLSSGKFKLCSTEGLRTLLLGLSRAVTIEPEPEPAEPEGVPVDDCCEEPGVRSEVLAWRESGVGVAALELLESSMSVREDMLELLCLSEGFVRLPNNNNNKKIVSVVDA